MNLMQFRFLIYGTLLCLSWCLEIAPCFGLTDLPSTYLQTPLIAVWILGCVPIMGVTFFVMKWIGRNPRHYLAGWRPALSVAEMSLRREVVLVVGIHAELLVLLILLLWFSGQAVGAFLGGIGGHIPSEAQWLMNLCNLVRWHWLGVGIGSAGFLRFDAKICRALIEGRGRVAAARWSLGVSSVIILAIVLDAYLMFYTVFWYGDLYSAAR